MWQRAALCLQALTPIHVGVGLRRIVNQTRYYIPARNLWAALTSALTLHHTGGNPHAGDYAEWGDRVDEAVRFSYLFVTVDEDNGRIVYQPRYDENTGLMWGTELTTEQFEERFLSLVVSTAIDASRGSADEGMLFEREAIQALIPGQNDETLQVFFTGHVYLRTEQEIITPDMLQEALQHVSIGGDQTYGLGLLRLEGTLQFEPCAGADHPTITLSNPGVLAAHAFYDPAIEFAGDVEPLVARLWDRAKGPGRLLQFEGAFFTPGTIVHNATQAEIGHKGYWHLLTRPSL